MAGAVNEPLADVTLLEFPSVPLPSSLSGAAAAFLVVEDAWMLRLRRSQSLSWFNPDTARVLAARLSEKLVQRMGGGGLMLTLTYDRSAYADARELYEAARDERHVRRFIHRLQKMLGVSLKGKWCRKMEFHSGADGWIHWHLLLDWRSKIPHATLMQAWGHGFVDVRKATKNRVRYVAKYIGKSVEAMPAWIMAEPSRSVKFFSVSPGFWESGECGKVERPLSWHLPDEDGDDVSRFGTVAVPPFRMPIYRTIGQVQAECRERVQVRVYTIFKGAGKDGTDWCRMKTHNFRMPLAKALDVIEAHGFEVGPRDDDGWFAPACADSCDAIVDDLGMVAWAINQASGVSAASRAAADADMPDALHLTDSLHAPTAWELALMLWNGDAVETVERASHWHEVRAAA